MMPDNFNLTYFSQLDKVNDTFIGQLREINSFNSITFGVTFFEHIHHELEIAFKKKQTKKRVRYFLRRKFKICYQY